MVVDIGPKNTTNEDAHRSEWRSALINSLTEPTLSEMSGYATKTQSRLIGTWEPLMRLLL